MYGYYGSHNVLKIAGSLGMTTNEYVFLLPWVIRNFNQDVWVSPDDQHLDLKKEFQSVLIVSTDSSSIHGWL